MGSFSAFLRRLTCKIISDLIWLTKTLRLNYLWLTLFFWVIILIMSTSMHLIVRTLIKSGVYQTEEDKNIHTRVVLTYIKILIMKNSMIRVNFSLPNLHFTTTRNFHHPCIILTYEEIPPLAPYHSCYFKMGEISIIGTLTPLSF